MDTLGIIRTIIFGQPHRWLLLMMVVANYILGYNKKLKNEKKLHFLYGKIEMGLFVPFFFSPQI